MGWRRILVVSIGILVGGWMAFDGLRALLVGDYVTPATGAWAGRLGPWATLLSAAGLDPRSTAAKLLHVACGGLWLAAAALLLTRPRSARRTAIAAAVAGLWYLPFGTVGGSVALVLLLTSAGGAAAPAGTGSP